MQLHDCENGAFIMGKSTVVGESEFEGIRGVHTPNPMENSQNWT